MDTIAYTAFQNLVMFMARFGEAILERREIVGFRHGTELAEASVKLERENPSTFKSFSQQSLSRWENDRTGEKIEGAHGKSLRTLAYLLKWTSAEFEERVGVSIGKVPFIEKAHTSTRQVGDSIGPMVPIRFGGPVKAGFRGLDMADANEYIEIPESILAGFNPDDCFALIVEGDSMMCEDVQKAIPEGSIAIFHEHLQPEPNEIICAYLEHPEEGEMRVLKKYKPQNGWITLHSSNHKVKPLIIDDTMNSRRLGVYLLSINPGSRIRHRMSTQNLVRKLMPNKAE